MISEKFAKEHFLKTENNVPTDKPIIPINANGAVGFCFVRRDKRIIHDDVMIVELVSTELDFDFVEGALRRAIVAGNFECEAKLYNRVKDLEIEVPVTDSKQPDLERQINTKAFRMLCHSGWQKWVNMPIRLGLNSHRNSFAYLAWFAI